MEYAPESYYKVCSRINNKLYGSFLIAPTSRFYLTYELNKLIWAPLGSLGILVFKEYNQARASRYAEKGHNFSNYIILEGKTVLPMKKGPLVSCIAVRGSELSSQDGDILIFMQNERRYNLYCRESTPSPPGTYACSGFLPEKEINDD